MNPRLQEVTSAVYPHLNDFTKNKIFNIRVDPLNSESQNQAKNIPSLKFSNQNLRHEASLEMAELYESFFLAFNGSA